MKGKHVKKKKKRIKPIHILLLAVILFILAVLVVKSRGLQQSILPPKDPHAGQVQVFNGDAYMWIVPDKKVARNPLDYGDFSLDAEGRPSYVGGEYKALRGVDVSQYQGNIDWQAVYDSGIRFAIIRAGGRYYGSGDLYTDDLFRQNIDGAKAAGLQVGVYFFSQAVSAEEARAEARYTAELLGDTKLDLPMMFDWERVSDAESRTDSVDYETMTDCAVGFCDEARQLGYEAGIYVYPDTAYNGYDMSELDEYVIWCSCVGNYPYFYYAHTFWQYGFEGRVDGIDGNCDMDMMFIKD